MFLYGEKMSWFLDHTCPNLYNLYFKHIAEASPEILVFGDVQNCLNTGTRVLINPDTDDFYYVTEEIIEN